MTNEEIERFKKQLNLYLYTNEFEALHTVEAVELSYINKKLKISVAFNQEDENDPELQNSLDIISRGLQGNIRFYEMAKKVTFDIPEYLYQRKETQLEIENKKKKYLSKIYSFLYQYDYIQSAVLIFIGKVLMLQEINGSNLSLLSACLTAETEQKQTMLLDANLKEHEILEFIQDFYDSVYLELKDELDASTISTLCKNLKYTRTDYESVLK